MGIILMQRVIDTHILRCPITMFFIKQNGETVIVNSIHDHISNPYRHHNCYFLSIHDHIYWDYYFISIHDHITPMLVVLFLFNKTGVKHLPGPPVLT